MMFAVLVFVEGKKKKKLDSVVCKIVEGEGKGGEGKKGV